MFTDSFPEIYLRKHLKPHPVLEIYLQDKENRKADSDGRNVVGPLAKHIKFVFNFWETTKYFRFRNLSYVIGNYYNKTIRAKNE